VRAWSSLRAFRGDASFRTWLLTIVWRRAMTRRRGVLAWWRRRASIDDARGVAAGERRADERVRDRELAAHIARAIEGLTPALRDALLLAQSGDYDYGEIAAMLGVARGTVKWRVSAARSKVRARLAALGYVDAR
jgi:RNA polymerase sigma-70 factor (ECF subfamily)